MSSHELLLADDVGLNFDEDDIDSMHDGICRLLYEESEYTDAYIEEEEDREDIPFLYDFDSDDANEFIPNLYSLRQQTGEITTHTNDTEPIVEPLERNSFHIDINGEDNITEDHEARGRTNSSTSWSSCKVDLEWIFVIANFIRELPSAVFDQFSSVHKLLYALLSMLLSFAALLVCIVELVYRGRKANVTWRWRGTLPWFYYPSQSHKPFGSFKDIIGLVCALCQCIVTTIGFHFCRRHTDNPIKISVWPIMFAFGLLCSKFLGKPEKTIS